MASLGKEQFLALYLSAGVISSMSSYLYKLFSKPGLSLGAVSNTFNAMKVKYSFNTVLAINHMESKSTEIQISRK